jgi:hypothetical protein
MVAAITGLGAYRPYSLLRQPGTSWGDQLTMERTSLAGKTRRLRLYDAEGQHLSIR